MPELSFWADNFNGIIVHLNHRDVTMVAVSKAPFDKLEVYKKRMGWTFKWVSSLGQRFQPRLSSIFHAGRNAEGRDVLQLQDDEVLRGGGARY
jgi:predicted dithiol-disulfide oxidoreductase (DUF899 family)